MAHSGPFKASEVGAGWEGMDSLARACEQARLTQRMAHCVLLYCRGLSWAEMGRVVGRSRMDCRRSFRLGVKKLSVTMPWIYSVRRRWARDILDCVRNRHCDTPGPAPIIGQTRTGIWREMPRSAAVITADDLAMGESDDEDLFALLLATLPGHPQKKG